jgi:hypothetical protein
MSSIQAKRQIRLGPILLVVIVGLAAFALSLASPRANPIPGLIGTAASSAPSAARSAAPIPADTLEQLAKAPPGVAIVPCSSSEPIRPDGSMYSTNPVWAAQHPAFRQLAHGYCADDPSATPLPGSEVVTVTP